MKNPLTGILLLTWFLLLYLIMLFLGNIRLVVGDSFETQVPDLDKFFPKFTTESFSTSETSDKKANKSSTVLAESNESNTLQTSLIDSIELSKRAAVPFDSLYPLLDSSKKVDTSAQRILLIGDSMAEALYFPFFEYCKWSNFYFRLVAIRGTASPWWASRDTLQKAIEEFKPTLVLFTLGANEITVPKLSVRKKLYKQIVEQLSATKYIYVTTPVWTNDSIYTPMMQSLIPANKLFISQGIELPRQKDGAHPNLKGSKIWADSICKWMVYKSAYPVYFKRKKPLNWKPLLKNPLPKNISSLSDKKPIKRKPAISSDSLSKNKNKELKKATDSNNSIPKDTISQP